MSLRINQNIDALNSYRNLSVTQGQMSKSLEKLSSGYRINRAADDAAGLAISEGLRSQVGGLKVAARNAQDGISVVQTTEGALTEVHSILQRLRDLAVQGANDSNNTEARNNITTEATQLVEELGRISESTNFNGTKLLNGDTTSLNFQVGADGDANSTIAVNLSGANIAAIADTLATTATAGVEFDVTTGTLAAGTYSFSVANGGVTTNVDVALAAAPTSVQGFADALNADSDFAANFTASVVKDADGVSTGIIVKSVDGGTVDTTSAGAGVAAGAALASVTGLDFSSSSTAQDAINLIDQQISTVSTARANLGAYQNRFEHTINNLNVAVENLSASESRIRDTDMASEMMEFTRSQILSQAGTAMLAQANQASQGVLSLLR